MLYLFVIISLGWQTAPELFWSATLTGADVTEDYIRVSDEMRKTFYDYLELIVGEKSAEHGSTLRLFKGIWDEAFFIRT